MTGDYAAYVFSAYAIAAAVLVTVVAQSLLAARHAEKDAAGEGTDNGDA